MLWLWHRVFCGKIHRKWVQQSRKWVGEQVTFAKSHLDCLVKWPWSKRTCFNTGNYNKVGQMDHDVTTARASLQPMKGARATVSHTAVRQMEFGILDNAWAMPLCLVHCLLHLLPMCNIEWGSRLIPTPWAARSDRLKHLGLANF